MEIFNKASLTIVAAKDEATGTPTKENTKESSIKDVNDVIGENLGINTGIMEQMVMAKNSAEKAANKIISEMTKKDDNSEAKVKSEKPDDIIKESKVLQKEDQEKNQM